VHLRAWPPSCERLPISWRCWCRRQTGKQDMALLSIGMKQKIGRVGEVL